MGKSAFSGLLLLSLTSTVSASENYSIAKFPVKYEINGEVREAVVYNSARERLETFNINGHAYVPVRFLVEAMGGAVSYDANTETIKIRSFAPNEQVGLLSQTKEEAPFKLSIYSAKQEYSQNEMLQVWGNLIYTGDKDIKMYHGKPFLTYYITDSTGFSVREPIRLGESATIVSSGNEIHQSLRPGLIAHYNIQKNDIRENVSEYITTEEAQSLPPGEYTVGIEARFGTADKDDDPHKVPRNDQRYKINAELKLTIK